MKHYPTLLTIAGSDSIGGAGIQADIKTASALGVYAMTAITALTAQNTCGVSEIMPTPPSLLRAQLEAVLSDVRPDAVKIGMVPDAASGHIIADILEQHRLTNIVVDPVMVATSGDSLTDDEAIRVLLDRLIPLATLVTPNLPEASRILGNPVRTPEEARLAAEAILFTLGPQGVLVKGGHAMPDDPMLTDLLLTRTLTKCFSHPRIDTPNTHGTGCTLSSAIASLLALGRDLPEATEGGINWLQQAIAAGADYRLGSGHGPVNHLFNQTPGI